MKSFKVDFIGIGAPRSGTTWIDGCLREHPQIDMTHVKELSFFNKKKGIYGYEPEWRYKKGIKWYKKQFPNSSKIKGDFTVFYLYDKQTPKLIYKHFPNTKIIVCLRNPIDRAYSNYWLHKTNFMSLEKQKTFEKAIIKQKEYLERGSYYKYLKRYYDVFPAKNIYVIFYNDILNKPEKVIRGLYKFLNVDSDFKPELLHRKINAPKISKIGAVNKVLIGTIKSLRNTPISNIIRFLEQRGIYTRVANKYINKTTLDYKYPKIKLETRKKLIKYFERDTKKLEKLLGVQLKHWRSL